MYKVYETESGKVLYHGKNEDNLEERSRQYANNNEKDVTLVKPSGATSTFYWGKLMQDDARRLALLQNSIDVAAAGGLSYRR